MTPFRVKEKESMGILSALFNLFVIFPSAAIINTWQHIATTYVSASISAMTRYSLSFLD